MDERAFGGALRDLLRSVVSDAADGVIVTDAGGAGPRIVYVNAAFAALTGYSATEAMGRNPKFLQGTDTDPETVWHIGTAVRERRRVRREILNYRKDGSPFWTELSIVPVFEGGACTHFFARQREISPHRRLEVRLAESESLLAAMFENVGVGLALTDETGRIVRANPMLAGIMGAEIGSVLGRAFVDFVPAAGRARAWAAHRAFLAGRAGGPRTGELRRTDGALRTVEVTVKRIETGGRLHALSSVRDITAERAAERRLLLNTTAIEHSQEMAIWTRADGTLFYVNETACRLLGFTRDELAGMRITELDTFLAGHTDPDAVWRDLWRTLRRRGSFNAESALRRKDGDTVAVEITSSHVRHDGEEFSCALMRDITRRKQAEAQILDARREADRAHTFLKELTGSIPGAVFQFGLRANGAPFLSFVSDGLRDLYGVSAEEAAAAAEGVMQSVVPGDRRRFRESLDRSAEALTPWVLEYRVRTPTGPKWVRGHALPRKMDDGTMVWNGILTDFDAQKAQEEHLRAARASAESANRAKSDFLANMSHELRTPLNAISGFAQLLQAEIFGPLGDERYRSYIRDIEDASLHLRQIVDDMLDLVKIETRTAAVEDEIVDVVSLVADAVRPVAARAEAKGLPIEIAVPRDCPQVRGDSRALKQVLMNLLSNAIKFTEAGHIRVSAQPGSAGMDIAVTDTGIGISADDIGRVMQPFAQVESGLARRHQGTGLGLTLSRGLTALHGGRLRIESEPGRGTTVTVSLPFDRVLASDLQLRMFDTI